MNETESNQNITHSIVLLNTCANCGRKFKPVKSMINEKLCDLCLGKK
jgi:hypothetical protein